MNRFAPKVHRSLGFTLLELCIVLFIMALLAGAAVPALHSALVEQALRNDSSQVALLVKTAMLSSNEQQRAYVLKLKKRTLSLEPQPDSDLPATTASGSEDETGGAAPLKAKLDHDLELPDSGKGRWAAPEEFCWQFEPNGLCPVPRMRVQMGDASLEMSFNALTGDVEDESLSVP